MYFESRHELLNTKFPGTKYLHALGTFSKAHLSTCTMKDLEECRSAMGGFGYSSYNGIDTLIKDHDVN